MELPDISTMMSSFLALIARTNRKGLYSNSGSEGLERRQYVWSPDANRPLTTPEFTVQTCPAERHVGILVCGPGFGGEGNHVLVRSKAGLRQYCRCTSRSRGLSELRERWRYSKRSHAQKLADALLSLANADAANRAGSNRTLLAAARVVG